jgi:hypothetical protein
MTKLTLSPRIVRLLLTIIAAMAILVIVAGCGHGRGGY